MEDEACCVLPYIRPPSVIFPSFENLLNPASPGKRKRQNDAALPPKKRPCVFVPVSLEGTDEESFDTLAMHILIRIVVSQDALVSSLRLATTKTKIEIAHNLATFISQKKIIWRSISEIKKDWKRGDYSAIYWKIDVLKLSMFNWDATRCNRMYTLTIGDPRKS